MTPKEEIIKLINNLPDDATIDDIMIELHLWTAPDNSLPIAGRERNLPHQKGGRWLN